MFRDNSRSRLNEATHSRLGCKIVVGVASKGGFKGVKCCRRSSKRDEGTACGSGERQRVLWRWESPEVCV